MKKLMIPMTMILTSQITTANPVAWLLRGAATRGGASAAAGRTVGIHAARNAPRASRSRAGSVVAGQAGRSALFHFFNGSSPDEIETGCDTTYVLPLYEWRQIQTGMRRCGPYWDKCRQTYYYYNQPVYEWKYVRVR